MPANYIGSRLGAVNRWMARAGLASEQGVALTSVGNGQATVRHCDGTDEAIDCAALLVAPGRVAHDPLSSASIGTGIEVQIIGDARKPRSYGNAIHEAAYLARRV